MPLGRFLPEFLQTGDGDEPEATAGTVIYECRHCGTDFDEPCEQCPVCGATEIATYEFGSGTATESESKPASEPKSVSEPDDPDD
ncbi:hypothetical protein ATJ93_1531 [Halopiger aswanensis]|uniref:Uncharacterized protein n=1 Tax=Halopiger aswanensis TaxID=148449 RepID=A0A3R7GV62_9EURY|nr:hypothetical protein ATJ93_1531 [Halopiger aswanensis]